MSTQSTEFHIDIPNYGKVPVQLNHGEDRRSRVDITHRAPTQRTDPSLKFLSDNVAPVPIKDPATKISQYAVKKQKLLTLTKDLYTQFREKKLLVGTVSGEGEQAMVKEELRSINENSGGSIITFDCPEVFTLGEETFTILLDWTEDTVETFPELAFFDPVTRAVTRPPGQNNFLLSSMDGGPNDPPVHPPWTAASSAVGPLNTQTTDFRTATLTDTEHYGLLNRQDRRPAVAVLDTGLKFNVHNLGEEHEWPDGPYVYRDADHRKRSFTLAYQDQTATDCVGVPSDNLLGYCSVLAYRQQAFRNALLPSKPPGTYTTADVINSPFDDSRVFTDADEKHLQEARHGSIITALIQQQGDNAPVLPVKSFDNIGFTTLFDVLNGFNYILHRRESANIRVVNTSWICTFDEPLLKAKIRQLMEAGIFVVAAAGNEGQTTNRSLDEVKAYPACYSEELPNVITVTSVRKTYFPPDLVSRRGDSVIGNLLSHAIGDLGLFGLLEGADDLIGAVVPTAGYVAVENYSTTYVNVGVVSTFGFYRSPFWDSKPIRGSSFACALVSAFVIRRLSTGPALLPAGRLMTEADMVNARQQLLDAMSGTDENLKDDYVKGGYYLSGYEVD